ncbi:MAG: CRISPR system precrRNA processing endoribonuclease RAMP protein Cas6 [Chloroflexota bacterium]|nr:CRISPR system precrRNA processing endoribonuclease RAMP protein Cas6 [Chloroflexota bacterium]
MNHFTAHRLRFVTEVQATLELNEHQGSAIRGSLFHALRNRFCMNRRVEQCAACPLVASCPVAMLVSTFNPESDRGRDVPRPFTVQPPLSGAGGRPTELPDGRVVFRYEPGARLEFGLTLYAQAMQLFPYVVLAVHGLEQGGIGRKVRENGWRRGTFVVREVWAENPLTGDRQPVMRTGDRMVQIPDVPITHEQICEWANRRMANERVTVRFLTPARITRAKHLIKPGEITFRPIWQRLVDRLESLSCNFSDTPLTLDFRALAGAAEEVQVVWNGLRWIELRSYSTRRRRSTPTSGFVGDVILECDEWTPFLPWLAWGQFTHVGKNAVKGDGWYELRISE